MKRTSSTFDSGDTVSSDPVRLFSNYDRATAARERHGESARGFSRRVGARFHGPRRNEMMQGFERESFQRLPGLQRPVKARELVSDLFKRAARHRKIAQTGETPGGRAKTSVFSLKERLADERS